MAACMLLGAECPSCAPCMFVFRVQETLIVTMSRIVQITSDDHETGNCAS